MKEAVSRAGVAKPATCHTMRHSFVPHLIEDGHDIRTVQEHKGIMLTSVFRQRLVVEDIDKSLERQENRRRSCWRIQKRICGPAYSTDAPTLAAYGSLAVGAS
ncbi:MAG: tyrosine-type recombinase/integrase, partial [Candidatus Methylomirabilales bacterium]